jgi:hypothetical protein
MKRKINIFYLIISVLTISLSGCELITIGSSKPKPIEISQKTPIGAVLLFKTKLDSNKIPDAVNLLIRPNGEKYLAI